MNIDASVFGEKNQAAIGGAAKDCNGLWVWCFTSSIGSTDSDSDSGKLSALVQGMKIAWQMRTSKIIAETDSENIFNWVNKIKGFYVSPLTLYKKEKNFSHPISRILNLKTGVERLSITRPIPLLKVHI